MTKYGYARVSSKTQEENSSLNGQKQQLIENGILEKNIGYPYTYGDKLTPEMARNNRK